MTQAELAHAIGYESNVSVYKLEIGAAPADVCILAKIAETLEVDLHELITGSPSPQFIDAIVKLYPIIELHTQNLVAELKVVDNEDFRLSITQLIKGQDHTAKIQEAQKRTNEIRQELTDLLDILKLARKIPHHPENKPDQPG